MVSAVLNAAVDGIFVQADRHWHKGEYCHIVNLDRMIVTARPHDLDSYCNAGWLLWSMNRDPEAIAMYQQGLRNNPKSWYMLDELGMYYYNRKKDYKTARVYYEKAVACKGVPFLTVHQLAHTYERLGLNDKALAVWEKAAASPTDQAAKANLERLKRKMQSGSGGGQ